ncbi:hypothetical protein MMC25_008276 [Agyrium rufum]|nr:hypothetical protein [Agyrium rufum]
MADVERAIEAERSWKQLPEHKSDQSLRNGDKLTVPQSTRLHQQHSCLSNDTSIPEGKDHTEEGEEIEEELRRVVTIPSKDQKGTQPETQTFPSPTESPQKTPKPVLQIFRPSQRRKLRKRDREEQSPSEHTTVKRRRISPRTLKAAEEEEEKSHQTHISESLHISEWIESLPEPFLPESLPSEPFLPDNMLQHRLAEKKSAASLRREGSASVSGAASVTPSDQQSRDGKSAAYAHKGYQMLLETMGVRLGSELGLADDSATFCQTLLKTKCRIPEHSLLRDDIYRETIADLQQRNESRVIQDVGRLFIPAVETVAKIREKRFRVFAESVSEGWDCCYPLTTPRPEPDYAVGFGRSGLSEGRISKLQPLIQDDPTFRSDFKSTYYMFFPFFSAEVKCGTSGLVIADRQNGHTMGVSVRGILSLYRLAGKEMKLHNKPVAFSVSHDHRMVRLTGWGPVISGNFYTIHPFPIHSFDVTALNGQERWTPRKFTVGVYEYGLTLLEEIKTIIDELPPDLNLKKVQPLKLGLTRGLEMPPPDRSGLLQQLNAHSLAGSGGDREGQQSSIVSTPSTSHQTESSSKRKSTPPTSHQREPSSKRTRT